MAVWREGVEREARGVSRRVLLRCEVCGRNCRNNGQASYVRCTVSSSSATFLFSSSASCIL